MSHPSDRQVRIRNTVIAVVLVLGALGLFWVLRPSGGPDTDLAPDAGGAVTVEPRPGAVEPPPPGVADAPTALEREWTEALGRAPRWPGDLAQPPACDVIDAELERVCGVLGVRRQGTGGDAICSLLEQAATELAARPPQLSGELKSQETMLGNVFHLFRVLGRERMGLLRGLLNDEEKLAEPLSLTLYRWLLSRGACDDAGTVAVEPLYDYATYMFTTMGGQAYLRRRTPRVQAMACFYGLQMIERAIAHGHNPHGVDPRPEIVRCRALVEGQEFVFKSRYLEELQSMQRDWDTRTGR